MGLIFSVHQFSQSVMNRLPEDIENLIMSFVEICRECETFFIPEPRPLGYYCCGEEMYDTCDNLRGFCLQCASDNTCYSCITGEPMCVECSEKERDCEFCFGW